MTETSTDVIEKEIVVRAARGKVWKSITDSREFGKWFKAEMADPFVAGARSKGRITHPGYEHLVWQATIVTMEAPHLFAFTWHPYGIDPKIDYSAEIQRQQLYRLRYILNQIETMNNRKMDHANYQKMCLLNLIHYGKYVFRKNLPQCIMYL